MFHKGMVVRVRKADTSDEWATGTVHLVSENGRFVGLFLDGLVRGGNGWFGGALPLIVNETEGTFTGLSGDRYEVEVRLDLA